MFKNDILCAEHYALSIILPSAKVGFDCLVVSDFISAAVLPQSGTKCCLEIKTGIFVNFSHIHFINSAYQVEFDLMFSE